MATVSGTHVHTADDAVPPLNDDLDALLEDLHGFSPALDRLADAARDFALEQRTLRQTQAAVTMLAGSTDQPGQQIDVSALVPALVQRLLNPDENPCLRGLPADVQAQAGEAAAEYAAHDADFTPRDVIAKAVYLLDPI